MAQAPRRHGWGLVHGVGEISRPRSQGLQWGRAWGHEGHEELGLGADPGAAKAGLVKSPPGHPGLASGGRVPREDEGDTGPLLQGEQSAWDRDGCQPGLQQPQGTWQGPRSCRPGFRWHQPRTHSLVPRGRTKDGLSTTEFLVTECSFRSLGRPHPRQLG